MGSWTRRPPLHADQPAHAQVGQEAAWAGKRIVKRGATPLPAFVSCKPNLPIAATCAAMATGGPGGGILFGLSVVRNAVSTVVVARTSTPILPIRENEGTQRWQISTPTTIQVSNGGQRIARRH